MSLPLLPSKFVHWLKVLSKFVSVQIIVQTLTMVSGLFLVRILNQKEYAYYTIATSIQATMTIIADMGISFGLSAIGGKIWYDRYRFGQLINTALKLRYSLAIISVTFVTPVSLWMLLKNKASLLESILITVVVLVGFNFQLTIGVFDVVPRLHSQISRIQKLDLVFNISRILILLIAYVTFLNAVTSTMAGTIALAIKRLVLGRMVTENIDRKASLNEEDREEIIKIIKQSAPNTIFFCFEAQITVWLISAFGTVQKVAELGALGRLAIIFSIIGSVLRGIILPSFARCQSPNLLRGRYLQILGTATLFVVFLVSLTLVFPDQILWIIGSKYEHLKPELIWVMVGTGFSFIVNTMWGMNSTKAWISKVWIYIPATLSMQVIGLLFLDVSTLKGVIIFGMASLIPAFCIQSYMTYTGLKSSRIT